MHLSKIPLLAIVLIAYNLLAFTLHEGIIRPIFSIYLFSGAAWDVSAGDLLLIAGLVLLYLEIIKSTHVSRQAAMDHALSMVVLIVGIVEFIVVPYCGTSTFLLIVLMSVFDVMAGFQVSIASARRDIEIDRVVNS